MEHVKLGGQGMCIHLGSKHVCGSMWCMYFLNGGPDSAGLLGCVSPQWELVYNRTFIFNPKIPVYLSVWMMVYQFVSAVPAKRNAIMSLGGNLFINLSLIDHLFVSPLGYANFNIIPDS